MKGDESLITIGVFNCSASCFAHSKKDACQRLLCTLSTVSAQFQLFLLETTVGNSVFNCESCTFQSAKDGMRFLCEVQQHGLVQCCSPHIRANTLFDKPFVKGKDIILSLMFDIKILHSADVDDKTKFSKSHK